MSRLSRNRYRFGSVKMSKIYQMPPQGYRCFCLKRLKRLIRCLRNGVNVSCHGIGAKAPALSEYRNLLERVREAYRVKLSPLPLFRIAAQCFREELKRAFHALPNDVCALGGIRKEVCKIAED